MGPGGPKTCRVGCGRHRSNGLFKATNTPEYQRKEGWGRIGGEGACRWHLKLLPSLHPAKRSRVSGSSVCRIRHEEYSTNGPAPSAAPVCMGSADAAPWGDASYDTRPCDLPERVPRHCLLPPAGLASASASHRVPSPGGDHMGIGHLYHSTPMMLWMLRSRPLSNRET